MLLFFFVWINQLVCMWVSEWVSMCVCIYMCICISECTCIRLFLFEHLKLGKIEIYHMRCIYSLWDYGMMMNVCVSVISDWSFMDNWIQKKNRSNAKGPMESMFVIWQSMLFNNFAYNSLLIFLWFKSNF